jgi:hypothetical protein
MDDQKITLYFIMDFRVLQEDMEVSRIDVKPS